MEAVSPSFLKDESNQITRGSFRLKLPSERLNAIALK